ncbi:hypothetical protein AN958_08142, partial [Leucoagaricus sp. SymC.cos]
TRPNPTPATAGLDRKYIALEGTLLFTSIWGQNTAEGFVLVFIAVINFWCGRDFLIAFLRLDFQDPFLRLTISAEQREKPVTTSSTQLPFIRFLKSFHGVIIPDSPATADKTQARGNDNLDGFEEVDPLEGLLAGPTFSGMLPTPTTPSPKTLNTMLNDPQRAVSINIHEKPYVKSSDSSAIIYPTRTFSSKWNCVLDLSSPQSRTNRHPLDPSDPSTTRPSVLPEPPSPFPVFGLQTSKLIPGATLFSPTTATLTSDPTEGRPMAGRVIKSSTPRLSAVPMSANPSRMLLPAQGQFSRSPKIYSAPPPPHHPQLPLELHHQHERAHSGSGLPPSSTHTPPISDSPQTPAYPASPPPSNRSSGMNVGVVGKSLEARRNRGSGVGPGVEPPTPIPSAYPLQHEQQESGVFGNEQQRILGRAALEGGLDNGGDTVIVSVGLLNVVKSDEEKGDSLEKGYDGPELGPGKLYLLDAFTLDIFVFNKSERTWGFEISCFERRRRRRGLSGTDAVASEAHGGAAKKMEHLGIIPMEGRVRIGPLLPSACQSMRMEFLAVSPGVHSVEALALTDIESGFSVKPR